MGASQPAPRAGASQPGFKVADPEHCAAPHLYVVPRSMPIAGACAFAMSALFLSSKRLSMRFPCSTCCLWRLEGLLSRIEENTPVLAQLALLFWVDPGVRLPFCPTLESLPLAIPEAIAFLVVLRKRLASDISLQDLVDHHRPVSSSCTSVTWEPCVPRSTHHAAAGPWGQAAGPCTTYRHGRGGRLQDSGCKGGADTCTAPPPRSHAALLLE